MTTATKTFSDDLLAFKQVLLDDLVRIIEERQPVTIRRWLKPGEAMHILGVSRHKLHVLRDTGRIVSRKIGDKYSYERESVMKYSPQPTDDSPQLNANDRTDTAPHSTAVRGPSPVDRGPTLSPQLYAGQEDEVSGSQTQED